MTEKDQRQENRQLTIGEWVMNTSCRMCIHSQKLIEELKPFHKRAISLAEKKHKNSFAVNVKSYTKGVNDTKTSIRKALEELKKEATQLITEGDDFYAAETSEKMSLLIDNVLKEARKA